MKIKEVAARAGVSPATVSRVLNGVSSVNPEYRERVLKTVNELGYRPNRLASNLRRQNAALIGVVVSDIENPHFTQMVRAVEDAAYRRGFRVLLCNTDETEEKQRSYLEVLAEERARGVILSPSNPGGAEISRLLDIGTPVVAFDRTAEDPRADAVTMDNAAGARLATEHLLRAGHERIGLVSGNREIETGAERLAGYEAAMLEAGLEPVSTDGSFRIAAAAAATDELLDLDGLTALIIANNLMSAGTLKALRARGVRVPEDIALVGIDDPFWADLVEPPLTTLAQPVRQMADTAVDLLFGRIDNRRKQRRRVVFDFDLVVRGSCGTATGARRGE